MSARPLRLLVVEADAAAAGGLAERLRRLDPPAKVGLAPRLAEALAELGADAVPVDLVFVGLTLPDAPGPAAIAALAAAAPALPLVVLTRAGDDATAVAAARRLGACDAVAVDGAPAEDPLARLVPTAIGRRQAEAALAEAQAAAAQATRAKSLFLSMMGHEIRTPLNGVLGMTRLLLDTPLDHRQRAFAETALSSAETLLGLVDDILDFARLDAETLEIEPAPFDVVDTIEEVRLLFAARAVESGLGFACAVAPGVGRRVLGDRRRVRQILIALVGNAVKVTATGQVSLGVEALPAGAGDGLRIVVTDGASRRDGATAGDLFADPGDGGTGMGLALCRRLVTRMGGTIICTGEGAVGGGTVVRVDLPLPAVAPGAGEAAAAAAVPLPPRCVLVVDDDPINRAVIAGQLERRGHTVEQAASGADAVRLAEGGRIDLILLDLRMPGMDGIATARAIRALPGVAGTVPLALLTAGPPALGDGDWRAAGLGACLVKPVPVAEIERLLADPAVGDGAAAPPEDDLLAQAGLMTDLRDLGMERMQGLVGLFRRASGADLAALRAAAQSGTLADLAGMAHRMAGAAASLHLVRLADACRAAERAARADDPAVRAQVAGIEDLWHLSLARIEALLDPTAPPAPLS